jgi:hypothetical protein
MRIALALAALLALGSSAAADSPRHRPPLGAAFTFRLLVTVSVDGFSETFGQIYRVNTTADDGTITEGTLTPLALVWRCPGDDTSTVCKQAQALGNVRREDDLIIAPLPEDISGALGRIGKVAVRDILNLTQVLPIPGLRDPSDVVKPEIGPTPLSVQSTALACDDGALRPFLPFGAAERATVPCKMSVEVAQSRVPGAKDGKYAQDMTYELSFAGRDRITVPAGSYDVAVVKFKSTGGFAEGVVTDGEWQFIESLGISARYASLTRSPNSSNTTRIVRELIRIEP